MIYGSCRWYAYQAPDLQRTNNKNLVKYSLVGKRESCSLPDGKQGQSKVWQIHRFRCLQAWYQSGSSAWQYQVRESGCQHSWKHFLLRGNPRREHGIQLLHHGRLWFWRPNLPWLLLLDALNPDERRLPVQEVAAQMMPAYRIRR